MSVTRFEPYRDPFREFDRLFSMAASGTRAPLSMPMDVYRGEDGSYHVEADLPGADPDSVEVTVEHGAVIIQVQDFHHGDILAPGKHRGKRNETAYVIDIANVLAESRGVSFDAIARQTSDNFFRLFGKVPRPAQRRHDAEIHHFRLRLFCGVPRPALGWGACDPNNPKNRRRRTSLLVERHNSGGVTRVLIDTPPDLREQLLDAEVDWVDAVLYTHEHADHTHGVDDLRSLFLKKRRLVDVYLDEQTAAKLCIPASIIASARRPAANIRRWSASIAWSPATGHRRRAGRHHHRPAHSAAAWRHPVAGLSLWQARLFLRPQWHAFHERRGLGRPRRLDR